MLGFGRDTSGTGGRPGVTLLASIGAKTDFGSVVAWLAHPAIPVVAASTSIILRMGGISDNSARKSQV
jgi:hypothetical protein